MPGVAEDVVFSPGGETIGIAVGAELSIWNIDDPTRPRTSKTVAIPVPHGPIAVGPRGRSVAVSDDHTVIWQSTEAVQPTNAKIAVPRQVDAIAISPSGQAVAVSYGINPITVLQWHSDDELPISETIRGHASGVDSVAVAFSPDERAIVVQFVVNSYSVLYVENFVVGGNIKPEFAQYWSITVPTDHLATVTVSAQDNAAAGVLDGTIIVGYLTMPESGQDPLVEACKKVAGQGLTREQWHRHLGAFQYLYPYRKTCPPAAT